MLSSPTPARAAMTMRLSTCYLRLMYSAAESLDDPHRVPMDVVVDEVVTVLKVLALADDVCADEDVQFARLLRHGQVPLLRSRREQREDLLEVAAGPERRLWGPTTGDERGL